jgi:hypothetical protein
LRLVVSWCGFVVLVSDLPLLPDGHRRGVAARRPGGGCGWRERVWVGGVEGFAWVAANGCWCAIERVEGLRRVVGCADRVWGRVRS